jgi:hypothetical protein
VLPIWIDDSDRRFHRSTNKQHRGNVGRCDASLRGDSRCSPASMQCLLDHLHLANHERWSKDFPRDHGSGRRRFHTETNHGLEKPYLLEVWKEDGTRQNGLRRLGALVLPRLLRILCSKEQAHSKNIGAQLGYDARASMALISTLVHRS